VTSYWRRQLSWQRVIVHRVVSAAVPTSTAEQREYNIFLHFSSSLSSLKTSIGRFRLIVNPKLSCGLYFANFETSALRAGVENAGTENRVWWKMQERNAWKAARRNN